MISATLEDHLQACCRRHLERKSFAQPLAHACGFPGMEYHKNKKDCILTQRAGVGFSFKCPSHFCLPFLCFDRHWADGPISKVEMSRFGQESKLCSLSFNHSGYSRRLETTLRQSFGIQNRLASPGDEHPRTVLYVYWYTNTQTGRARIYSWWWVIQKPEANGSMRFFLYTSQTSLGWTLIELL